MNELAPTPITSVDPAAYIVKKLFVIGLSGDGGCGKTTAMNTLSDHYQANGIDVVRIDADSEKTDQGSFSKYHKNALKIDIRKLGRADIMMDALFESQARIVLADLAANLQDPCLAWVEATYESLVSLGFGFLFVASVSNSSGSVTALLQQAKVLKGRGAYLTVRGEREFRHPGEDDYFGYFDNSPEGKLFLKLSKSALLHIPHRMPQIQTELTNRGLTLYQALHAPGDKPLGPILSKFSSKLRMTQYYKYLESQLLEISTVLLP